MSSASRDPTGLSWTRVRGALEHALDLSPEEQSVYLAQVERDDPTLNARLRELLARAATRHLDPAQPLAVLAQELALPALPRQGDRVGRFSIVRLLGTGGMGAVYEAHDPALNRSVAIKVIHAALLSRDYVRRFEREAHALARLRHPGIAQVYETGWIENPEPPPTPPTARTPRTATPYIAMEFIVEARPLEAKGLFFAQLVERFQSVLSAVQHAHEHGVIHCDLKPANILLDRSSQPKLIDFGIARSASQMETSSGRTAGTLRYMSPERCGGRTAGGAEGEPESTGDTRTDVFALGVILYELIEGRSPYAAIDGSLGELLDAVRAGAITPPTLALAPADMRKDLRAILGHALALDPADRYSSVAAIAEDLHRLLTHEPITARPPTLLREIGLLARRNRVAVTAAAAVGIAVLLGGVAATIGLVHARNAQAQAEAEAIRAKRIVRFLEGTIGSVSSVPVHRGPQGLLGASEAMTAWMQEGSRFGQARRTGEAARVVDVLLHAAEQVGVQFADDPLLEAQLDLDLAHSLREVGEWSEATVLVKRALELRMERLGPESEDTLKARVMLALYASADPGQIGYVHEALRRVQARFGRSDGRWFQLRSHLVDTYARWGGYPAAVADCEEAISSCSAVFGPTSREMQVLRFQLGIYLARVEGGRERGLALAQDALEKTLRLDGRPGLYTTQGRFELAQLYLDEDPARAEAIFRECLAAAPGLEGSTTILCYEVGTRLYEALMSQHKLAEGEGVAREQLRLAEAAMGDASYYTIKAKARVARAITWRVAIGEEADLTGAEQLAREAAVDGLRFDEKSISGNYDAYFRGIWAAALVLHRDAGSLDFAERLLEETLEARRSVEMTPWCDGYLQLVRAQLLQARERGPEAEEAFARAATLLDQLQDPRHPMVRTLEDLRARR